MTDTPRTAAGREHYKAVLTMHANLADDPDQSATGAWVNAAILAIEAEAADSQAIRVGTIDTSRIGWDDRAGFIPESYESRLADMANPDHIEQPFNHIDWCSSNGPYGAPDCDCPGTDLP